MRERITARAPTSEEEILHRLQSAKMERELARQYNSHIVNAQYPIPSVYETVKNIIQLYCEEHDTGVIIK